MQCEKQLPGDLWQCMCATISISTFSTCSHRELLELYVCVCVRSVCVCVCIVCVCVHVCSVCVRSVCVCVCVVCVYVCA